MEYFLNTCFSITDRNKVRKCTGRFGREFQQFAIRDSVNFEDDAIKTDETGFLASKTNRGSGPGRTLETG